MINKQTKINDNREEAEHFIFIFYYRRFGMKIEERSKQFPSVGQGLFLAHPKHVLPNFSLK